MLMKYEKLNKIKSNYFTTRPRRMEIKCIVQKMINNFYPVPQLINTCPDAFFNTFIYLYNLQTVVSRIIFQIFFLRELYSKVLKGKHMTHTNSLSSILMHFPTHLLVKTVSTKCSFSTPSQNVLKLFGYSFFQNVHLFALRIYHSYRSSSRLLVV